MCLNSFTRWFQNKPPIVIFISTLIICAFTLIGLYIYVEVNKLWLTNPNVRDWNSFYKKLSRIEICLPYDTKANIKVKKASENDTISSELVLANVQFLPLLVNSEMLRGSEKIDSIISDYNIELIITEDMIGRRVHIGEFPQQLKLIISSPGKKLASEATPVCILLEGPSSLLPNSKVKPSSCTIKEAPSLRVPMDGPCNGTHYGMSLKQESVLTPLLNESAVKNIQHHLLNTAACLAVLIVTLFLCSFCTSSMQTPGLPTDGQF